MGGKEPGGRVNPLAALRDRIQNPLGDVSDDLGGPAASFAERYKSGELLGRGGMGEVRAVRDRHLGREVALKRMHADFAERHAEARDLFLREARIQGRLEHPSVVPVYDLGIDGDGSTYFTMKRVAGMNLAEVFTLLARGHVGTAERFPRRRLLKALAQASLAVEYAHRRGFVHRDLKPSNLMLGEFGEVYVVDWGLAGRGSIRSEREVTQFPGDEHTFSPVGTPGYAPPEQVDRDEEAIGPSSDVWGLGTILFEILAEQPFIESQGSASETLEETHFPRNPRPSVRRPDLDVPPELDEICARALAWNPEQRYPSAREFHDELEAYLDGVRDVEARREAADRHAAEAERLAERALTLETPEALPLRVEALQQVRTALGLAPEHAGAMATLVSLLRRPPRFMPEAVAAEIDRLHHAELLRVAPVGTYGALIGMTIVVTGCLWAGIRAPALVLAIVVLCLASAAVTGHAARTGRATMGRAYLYVAIAVANLLVITRVAGPLVIVPALGTALATVGGMAHERPHRLAFLLIAAAACLGPIGLEQLGVLPASQIWVDGGIRIVPQMVDIEPVSGLTIAAVSTLFAMGIGFSVTYLLREQLSRVERERALLQWELGQMVALAGNPEAPGTGDAAGPRPTPPQRPASPPAGSTLLG